MKLTKEEVNRFQERARYVATKRGYSELADDFASQIFVYFGEKPDRGATIDQLFIDFLRETYGRPGTPGGDARIFGSHHTVSLDSPAGKGADGALFHEFIGRPSDDSEHEFRDGDFAHCFSGREREIYELYFVDEISEKSIGELIGITESRVSQILGPMKERIRRAALLAEGAERMEWDESFLSFQISWIAI